MKYYDEYDENGELISPESQSQSEETATVKDVNGATLQEGDSVKLIKDLKVKSSSTVLKRGTVVKNIRLTENSEEIEGKIEKIVMVLKTCFVQKM